METPVVCYYHDPCLDGFTAAWIISKFHLEAEFIGVSHDRNKWPEPCQNADVFIVDFTFEDLEYMENLIEMNASVTHLDHHETALSTIESLRGRFEEFDYSATFDMDHSGAGLVFNHFFPGKDKPYLVARVEDRDLWQFQYEDTKAFCEGLKHFERSFKDWDWADGHRGQQQALQEGTERLRVLLDRCAKQIRNTGVQVYLEMPDQTARSVVFTRAHTPGDFSEQTNMMIDRGWGDLVGAYFLDRDDNVKFRLTSNDDGPHAGNICAYYGGGGHPNAAGFMKTREEIENSDQGLEIIADQLSKFES